MNERFRVADGLASAGTVAFHRGADGSVVATRVPDPCPTPDDVQVLFILDADSWKGWLACGGADRSTEPLPAMRMPTMCCSNAGSTPNGTANPDLLSRRERRARRRWR
jgi:hypothetical protein